MPECSDRKRCEGCGAWYGPLYLAGYGRFEGAQQFAQRRFCSVPCAVAARERDRALRKIVPLASPTPEWDRQVRKRPPGGSPFWWR